MARTSFVDYLLSDVFSQIPGITARPMFGAYGLYKDGIFFGLVEDDTVYFKVDELTKKRYQEEASKPFTYIKKGNITTLNFYEVPGEIIENRTELEDWITQAVTVAIRRKK